MAKNMLLTFVYLILYLLTHTTQTIFQPTSVFYSRTIFCQSELCTLGHVNPAGSQSFTCTTIILQENIVRSGIALSEVSKSSNQYFSFNASVSAGGTMTSSFTITIQMAMPSGGCRLSYFLLVIKSQTTVQMIDLVHWSWGPGTNVDTEQNWNRTISQTHDLTTLTVFTSGTGLTVRSLLTSLHMTPKTNWWDGSYDNGKNTEITLLASNSGNTLNITLNVLDETRISFIRGIVLMYNPMTIAAEATAKTWDMKFKEASFSNSANYNFANDFLDYGPGYNGKCLLGYNRLFLEGYHRIDFQFGNTSLGNYSIMNFNTFWNPTRQYGIIFCFGNDSIICGEDEVWIDSLNTLCYLPIKCPLPVFALWTQVNVCPICTQLICTNCAVTNRSNCLTCGPLSTLTSGVCVCNAGYWPLMTAISTSTLGMWNNVANSETQCRYNCTAQIPNCMFDKCTSGTFCTQCMSGFAPQPINATDQSCVACPVAIANCITCSSPTVCTLCDPLYFIMDWNKQCKLCGAQIPGCLTCQPWWPCLTCDAGWKLVWGGCVCDPVPSNLLYCQTCSNPTTCTACVSNLYFLKTADTKCYPCSTFDPNCLQCSAENVCTLCMTTYGMETYTNASTLCVPCSAITNCLECLVSTTCTVCAATYYPISTGTCELCNIPIQGCSTCLVATTCLTCEVGWLLTSPTCTCDSVASGLLNCQTCSNPLICTACVSNLYYVAPADNLCYLCSNFDSSCGECSAQNVCTLCIITYGVETQADLTTLCVLCSFAIPDCLECLVSTTCTLCGINHYILGTGMCELCSIPMPGCLTCTDGATCTSCDVGWTLTSGQCVCDPTTSNLLNCQTCFNPTTCITCVSNIYYLYSTDTLCYPCTTFDTNCLQCSAFQVCTLCSTSTWGVYTHTNGSALCILCSTAILNCVECQVSTVCTLCDTNYFITGANDCQLCNVPVPGCLTCTPTPLGVACNTCDVGWAHVIFTCVCDPGASGLANCQTCADPTICTRCVSTEFYIETTDSQCYPCTTFDPNCVTCGSFNRCSMCATTYGIQTNADGTTLCVLCNTTLSNCTECLVVSACTNCDLEFGLNLAQTCSTCGSMIRGCVQCETSLVCLVCQPDSFLIMGKCRFCWEIFQCTACVSDAVSIGCVSCQTGYFLTPDPVSGVTYCRICKDLTSYCQTCNSSQCLTCQYPYLLGSDNTCSVCSPGFQYNNGFCTNITGCQNIVLDAQGKQLCIACVQSLHFIMDAKNNKCVCTIGFKQQYDPLIALLPRCVPICGDGLIMPQYQGCDDNNTIANDGCSLTCQIQSDFDCGLKQPSVCQLHVDIGSIEFSHVSRVLGQNQGLMVFKIFPKHQGLTKMKWDQLVKFNFSTTSVDPSKISFNYQPLTGQLMVTVPYNQQLQASHLQSFFALDPKYIVSQPSSFLLTHLLHGVNAPLIFQQQAQLATQKNINLITLLLTILLLLQFYAGSYSHKMIGLQTIQLIQSIYFVRMVAASSSTSLMNSINSIQYSAGGYHNEEIFFGDTTDVELSLSSSTAQQFLMINLKRYFLLNANLSLFPIIIAIAIFIISLVRKYNARNHYIQTKQQQLKDRYTAFRRSSQWFYDHFVFPYIMMFSLISYFQTILLLSSPSSQGNHYASIENPSFAVHMIVTLSTIAIYCYELFSSFQAYSRYSMTQSQRQQVPKSMVQKLQHDENNVDRANYHPAYIFCYLLYYFVLSLCMVGSVVLPQFTYALQVNMGLAFVYFIAIVFWKPYAQFVNVHNHFLKFYYGTFVVFLTFCYIFARMGSLGSGTYITIMYLVTVLIGCIMAGGFVRLYIQFRFRKALQLDSKLISDIQIRQINKKKKPNPQNGVILTKKQALVLNNQYAFENQLKEYEKNLMAPSSIMNTNLVKNLSITNDSSKKDYLMNSIKKDLHKRKQKILLQTIAHQGYTNEMRRINERLDDNQKDGKQESLATGDNNTSNLVEQILDRSILGDSLLDKKDVGLQKSAKGTREDIKVRLRKEWALMDYE